MVGARLGVRVRFVSEQIRDKSKSNSFAYESDVSCKPIDSYTIDSRSRFVHHWIENSFYSHTKTERSSHEWNGSFRCQCPSDQAVAVTLAIRFCPILSALRGNSLLFRVSFATFMMFLLKHEPDATSCAGRPLIGKQMSVCVFMPIDCVVAAVHWHISIALLLYPHNQQPPQTHSIVTFLLHCESI